VAYGGYFGLSSMFDFRRVAIILPERLGDALFHSPSIRLLKTVRPNISIEIIALSTLSASIVENSPFIDRVHVAPSKSTLKRLANSYDVVMNIHDHAASRKVVEWLGIPSITATPVDPAKHQSENSLAFFQSLLQTTVPSEAKRYDLFPTEENFSAVGSLLKGVATGEDILIGCHVGCHSIAKRGYKIWKPLVHPKVWPLEHFIELEARLRHTNPCFRLVLTGSKSEKKLGKIFMKAAPATIDLIGKTSVTELAALMRSLILFVTGDTGALHTACATNVGILALFGPTSSQNTGPYPMQPNYRILQAPTIDQISVSKVYDAILNHPDIDSRLRPIMYTAY
jgi:ADP-heptose:LPS heptosyltransferase